MKTRISGILRLIILAKVVWGKIYAAQNTKMVTVIKKNKPQGQ